MRLWVQPRNSAPLLTTRLRAEHRGQAGHSWYVDETYVKVKSVWCYVYRAINRDGHLVDTLPSDKRDVLSAKAFFKQTVATVGHKPERVRPISSVLISERCFMFLAVKSFTIPVNTLIIGLSRIIAASDSATIRCVASVHSALLPVFVLPLVKFANIFVLNPCLATNVYHCLKNAKTSVDDGSTYFLPGR